ncbi:MAG TPA: phosphoribosyltransferase [Permianibacter sp.]|nr:phosphoribosyltransferase [Permianibacter sp.]
MPYGFPFRSRTAAGHALAEWLHRLQVVVTGSNALVLALPRGGVPVAAAVAEKLALPLDVIVVRKLGCPGYSELAMGAVASGNIVMRNEAVIAAREISETAIAAELLAERAELQRRERIYRGNRPPLSAATVAGKDLLLVDDGIATGFTMRAAIMALRQLQPARILVAVPVASPDSIAALQRLADGVYCLETPAPFYAIGQWYEDFHQLNDDDVCALLSRAGFQQAHRHEQATD